MKSGHLLPMRFLAEHQVTFCEDPPRCVGRTVPFEINQEERKPLAECGVGFV
jgi:hypothetical protein